MGNSKSTNIYILDIEAAELAKPNRRLGVKELFYKHTVDYISKIPPEFEWFATGAIKCSHPEIDINGMNDFLVLLDKKRDAFYKLNPRTESYAIKGKRDLLYIGSLWWPHSSRPKREENKV